MDVSFYKRLARDGVPRAGHLAKALDWNPDQPRDPDGKFGSGGGGAGSSGGGSGSSSGWGKLPEAGKEFAHELSQRAESLEKSNAEPDRIYHAHMEAAASHRNVSAFTQLSPAQRSESAELASKHEGAAKQLVKQGKVSRYAQAWHDPKIAAEHNAEIMGKK